MVESAVGEPFIDADDIADVAVATLLDPSHIGRIYELTGPTADDLRPGRPRDLERLPDATSPTRHCRWTPTSTSLVSAGFPEEDASGLAYLFDEVLDGRNAHVDVGVHVGARPRGRGTSATSSRPPYRRAAARVDDVILAGGQVLNGLLAGIYLAFVVAVMPALHSLPDDIFVTVMNRISVVIVNPVFLRSSWARPPLP